MRSGFDNVKRRPFVKRAIRSELLKSKNALGVAEEDAIGEDVSILVAGEVAANAIKSQTGTLTSAGVIRKFCHWGAYLLTVRIHSAFFRRVCYVPL